MSIGLVQQFATEPLRLCLVNASVDGWRFARGPTQSCAFGVENDQENRCGASPAPGFPYIEQGSSCRYAGG